MKTAMMMEAISTSTALLTKFFRVGQETLCTSSS